MSGFEMKRAEGTTQKTTTIYVRRKVRGEKIKKKLELFTPRRNRD
jgi:hypothetical protein